MDPNGLPFAEFAFAGPLGDRLVAAILAGAKVSTTGLLEEYRREDKPVEEVGQRALVVDSAGHGVAVIETIEVEVKRMPDVDLAGRAHLPTRSRIRDRRGEARPPVCVRGCRRACRHGVGTDPAQTRHTFGGTLSGMATVTTPWGKATCVEEVSVPQRAGDKRFTTRIELLEATGGERLVRFSYATGGSARRGPVTLRERDLAKLRVALGRAPALGRVLKEGGA